MNKISNLFKSKIVTNGIWMILLQGFNTILPLLTLPYITRILSTSAYGEFSIALNWISYFQVIVEYGFGLSGAKRAATQNDKKEISKIHSNIITARFILMLLCIIAFIVIILTMKIDQTQTISMSILFLMVLGTVFQQNWYFQGIAEMKNITVINIISRITSVVLIFLLVKQPSDLLLYCLLYASNYIISGILSLIIIRKKYKIIFRLQKRKDIINELKDGWPLFISSAMSKIFGSIGITILGIISTKEAAGTYSAINKIPYIMTLLFSALAQAIYPFMCKAHSKSFKNGIKMAKKYSKPIIMSFLVLGILIILGNKILVNILFGSEYINSSTLLIPFVIWIIFGIINNFLGIQTLVASGHQREYSKAFTISIILMLLLMFLLGRQYNEYGIAYASMISEIILSILLYAIIRRINKKEER